MINPALIFYIDPTFAIPKYVYSNTPYLPTNAGEVVSGYTTGYTDASTIETYFGVGVSGMTAVNIFYTRGSVYLNETIYADITSSASFWADITGWLYLNNFYDISYVSNIDAWKINDIANATYIYIIKEGFGDTYVTMSGDTYVTMSGDTYITN